jgi:hypothetical protein
MKFTIEEFKNYLKSQDSLGDAMYYLTEENVEKANTTDVVKELKNWLIDSFQDITYDESNGESIDEIDITVEENFIEIDFSVDCDGYGVHDGNTIKIYKDGKIKIYLAEVIESGGIPNKLEKFIKNEFNSTDRFQKLFKN